MNPAFYKMQLALVQRQLAELYVAQIDNDNRRAQMQVEVSKLLGAANIPVPPTLADNGIDADKATAAKSAGDAYAEADKQIDNLTSGGPPVPLKNIARVQAILTKYGQVQLARAMNDPSAKDKLADAQSALTEAVQDGLQIPPLPPELAAAAAVPATPTAP